MTPEQLELITSITRIALSGAQQTGLRVMHDVRSDTDERGTYVVSEIRIVNRALEPLHKTMVQIDEAGRDEPAKAIYSMAGDIDYGERTLIQQRDELVEFIATHRKQEAA